MAVRRSFALLRAAYKLLSTVIMPYSGLFPWGANFRYFRGSPGCHKIFHSCTKIFHTLCSADYTCSNLDWQRFVTALFHYLQYPWPTESPFSMQAVPCVRAEEVNREV